MIYFADLHIHSRFSRATSRDCNLLELARWAALKGIRVLATGDFTHPEWSRELREMLAEAEEGLFRLKGEYLPSTGGPPGGFGPEDVRFILNVEISSIYKKDGATRKVHNLVFMPDLESMDRFSKRLERIGNIRSDGRPILGLDSRDLLEIALETTPESFLIPAHVWTPWFSVLGSKSGFDSVEACFGDLAHHVFALETGLSSDPEMNHRVASLDKYTLVSNSDTHSPSRLGREANIFRGMPGYFSIRDAIRAGGAKAPPLGDGVSGAAFLGEPDSAVAGPDGFVGTIEFFPEEGKYHLDGHRKCGVRLDPAETEKLGGKCPVCGHAVTVGVMNRVNELGARMVGELPQRAAPFWRMLPLVEIVAQALGVGQQSKRVSAVYQDLLRGLGPELMILWALPLVEIGRYAPDIIVEGVRRVRRGDVSIQAGYDGEYGTVELFGPGEREHFGGQDAFLPVQRPRRRSTASGRAPGRPRKKSDASQKQEESLSGERDLNDEQQQAVMCHDRPVLVQAGPGTGKTRTLTHRIAALIHGGKAVPEEITAVTFTRKAAEEMRHRLKDLVSPEKARGCWVGTFHQLGGRILEHLRVRLHLAEVPRVLDEDRALSLFRDAVRTAGLELPPARVARLFERVSLLKQDLVQPEAVGSESETGRAHLAYQELLKRVPALDLDDLLAWPVRWLQDNPLEARSIGETMARHLLVDEFQDVNRAQYETVRLLKSHDATGLFSIGDPNQAIYGFRGANRDFFMKFTEDFPATRVVRLTRNYRSQAGILRAALHVLDDEESMASLVAERVVESPIKVAELPNAALEGKYITRTIESLIGGSSFFTMDAGRVQSPERSLGFRDFAVLFRLNAVGDALEEEFKTSGIPYQRAKRAKPEEEAEAFDPRAEAVSLMTIHASKGLEFPVVFVAGCEEGVIPYVPPGDSEAAPADPGEERRLLYVAMTRAAEELFLTASARRTLFGKRLEHPRSAFLVGLDESFCDFQDPLAGRRTIPRQAPKQCELFG